MDQGLSDNSDISGFFGSDGIQSLGTTIRNVNDSKGYSVNGMARLNRKFMKKRREIEFRYDLSHNSNQTDGTLLSNSNFLLNPLLNDTIDQKKTNGNNSTTHYSTLTYTEPLSKSWILTSEYYFEYGKSGQERYTYNQDLLTNQFTVVDSLFTNDFSNDRIQQRGLVMLNYLYKNHKFMGGMGYRNIQIANTNQFSGLVIDQNISNFLHCSSYCYSDSPPFSPDI